MKKFSRKNYSGLSHFASKAGIGSSSSSSAAAATAPPPTSSPAAQAPTSSSSSGGGILKRPTWADKVRDKLPELGENEYEVLWERGVLGVIFLESEKNGIPYVSKATESCISPLVHAGDVLKYVNVVCSHDHSFSEFFKILATMKKPVLLRFERSASSTTSSDGEDSPLDQRSSSSAGIGDHSAMSNGLKVLRSNSVPQPEPQPKTGRSAFWRTVSSKEPPPPPVVVTPPVVHVNEYAPAAPMHAGSSGAYAPVKLQPPVPSSARPYDVSPRDVYSEYAPPHEIEFYEYEVYWETGSLGLFFGEDRATNLPVVTRSTPNANSVVQRMVAVNDTLVSANHVQSRDFTFEAFFARLQQMNKPVRLVFRRKVDAAAVPAPARARKASVTVDSLTSPGDAAARRLPTPPRHLPSVDEQAARTPPTSPAYARESVRESRRDGSARSRKPELDIDTCVSPPLAPRDSPPATLPASVLEQPRSSKRSSASPLNLAGASAAIMRSGSDSSSSPTSSRELDEPDFSPLEPLVVKQSCAPVMSPHAQSPPATATSPPSVSPTSRLSQSYVQAKSSSSTDTVSRQSAPTISLDIDEPPSRNLALSSPLPVAAAAAAASSSSSLATREEIASWMSDSSDDEDHGESDVLTDAHSHALSAHASGVSASGVMTFSPPPSPKRASIQRLDDLDLEAKPAAVAVAEVIVVEPSSPRQERSVSSPTKAQPVRTSSESRSLWEEAAEAPALSSDAPTRLSDEDDDFDGDDVADEPAAGASSVDHDVAYPVDAAFDDDAVVAAPVIDDAVAVGVELGIVADVAIGIAVDADVVVSAASPVSEDADGSEPALAVVAVAPVANEALAVVAEAVALDDSRAAPAAATVVTAVDIDIDDPMVLRDDAEPRASSDLQSELESTVRTGLGDDDSDVLDAIDQDITAEIDGNDLMPPIAKLKSSSSASSSSSSSSTSLSPFKANKAVVHANLAKYKRKAKNSRAVTKLPALTEELALTVPLVAPNAVNTTVQVRGRSKPKPSMLETPDSTTYLVKWKESRSIGLQLKEVRLAKGVFPLVTDVCQEPCCELLKHVCIGDVIVEINGRNTSLMGVKKTVSFLKSCSKTTLLKLRHGPGFVAQRVSAHV